MKRSVSLALLLGLALSAPALRAQQAALPAAQPLWPAGAPGALGTTPADQPSLTPFVPAPGTANGTAVVVFPGGGYQHLSMDKEGYQVARWLNTLGVTAFVATYRLGPKYRHPVMLGDAQRAVRTVRARAAEWGVDPDRVGVLGFSAGGHLASSVGTHFDAGRADAADPVERRSSRPDFLVLLYPVITMGAQHTHRGSRRNLIGEPADTALVELLSNERQVTAATPPTFLVHTTDDAAVPVENSLLFYTALRRAGVPAELHVYETGPHGFGLAPGNPVLSGWAGLAEGWLRARGLLAPPADSVVHALPLAGPLAGDSAEISGMAWDGDRLILLPQYPRRFRRPGDDGALFYLERREVEAAVDAVLAGRRAAPLTPRRLPVRGAAVAERIPGFEGFEAVAIAGERAYLTVEAEVDSVTTGYLVRGTLERSPYALRLEAVTAGPVRPPPATRAEAVRRANYADEAVLVHGDRVITLNELHGLGFGSPAEARLFGADLAPQGGLAMPRVEYRVTDATAPDAEGRFWVLNYFYTGSPELRTTYDPLAPCAGRPATQSSRTPVERLLEMRLTLEGVRLTGRAPRYLAAPRDAAPTGYNWEGVARLGERGLLVATDQHPRTVLGFAPLARSGATCLNPS